MGLVLLAAFPTVLAQAQNSPPDIFLVTIDTLRADHVHCYGYDGIATPAIDALAHDGIRFAEAFTPSPLTNTSHTTILTGLLPSSHGVQDFGIPLASSYPTAAELLKASGYHTAAFIGAVILDSKALAPGLDRGFDFYDNFPAHPATKSRYGRVERRGTDQTQAEPPAVAPDRECAVLRVEAREDVAIALQQTRAEPEQLHLLGVVLACEHRLQIGLHA